MYALLYEIDQYLKRNLKVTIFEESLIIFRGRERKSVGFFEDPQ